ncbi:UNVERIFIED_CONTAM: hypothetical protein Slati_2239700 [Sesamum latifolium]|uniref:CCHC-type domain-containing protein n=1 Tax=Sesamum latifolium TaxID=2727402 RepID=A0AAW2WYM7_9LAMI
MTNDIQKQYDRHDDVASIMLRMKEVYAVLDRHIRYAATKIFFRTKMTEGSSVREHGIKMRSLVEKLEDLQAGLDNDTYIDVILQSLPPSYDPFVINYNMNGLEKSINELINMLVQYEATTKKSEPSVLVGEASTSKAKGKGARRWKRKNGKAKAAASALSAPVAPVGMGKGKGKVGSKPNKTNDVCIHCREKGHWKRECPKLLSSAGKLYNGFYVLQQHDLIMTAQNKRKMDHQENAQILHARLGYISQDRIKRLVNSKSLEIDDLDHLPACESCLKGKMTKKPFVGQSTLASGLLDLIHLDVCGPLNRQARAKLLNMAPSKTVAQTPYQIWHGKPAFYKYLRVWGSPAYVKRLVGDKLDSRSSLCRCCSWKKVFQRIPDVRNCSLRNQVKQHLKQLDNNPKTYGEAMSDIDSKKWIEAMKSEMDSMSSNKVWTLVDPRKRVKSVGCKWSTNVSLELTGRLLPSRLGLWRKVILKDLGLTLRKPIRS